MPNGQPLRAIVVGASSGIGAELVKQLAAEGAVVAALARRLGRLEELKSLKPEHIYVYEHDVSKFDEIPDLFTRITGEIGGLDLIIYNSGIMPDVGPTEFDFAKDKQMIDVNLLGGIAWLNQAALRMQGTGHGSIVVISSVAGDRGRSGQPVYNTSKAALTAFAEALRNRLAKKGIAVVTIKPGPVDTDMIKHLGFKNAMSAETAARIILTKRNKTGEHYLSPIHRLAFYIIKRIPSPIFRKLKI